MYKCNRFKVGDKGQRYEVTYSKDDSGKRYVLGWTDNLEAVKGMMESIRLHPEWHSPSFRDRNKK